jgi:hypothetical protein
MSKRVGHSPVGEGEFVCMSDSGIGRDSRGKLSVEVLPARLQAFLRLRSRAGGLRRGRANKVPNDPSCDARGDARKMR